MGYCMCGADDCRQCHPGNFRDGRYIGDLTEDEMAELEREGGEYE
jgi:hypothetical protein